MSALTLAAAVASLRDSVRRISAEADDASVAVRATRLRIQFNEIRKGIVVRDLAGTMPPVPPGLASSVLDTSGRVSLADPDDSAQAGAALAEAEDRRAECDSLLEAARV
jgi:hypothetical protein